MTKNRWLSLISFPFPWRTPIRALFALVNLFPGEEHHFRSPCLLRLSLFVSPNSLLCHHFQFSLTAIIRIRAIPQTALFRVKTASPNYFSGRHTEKHSPGAF